MGVQRTGACHCLRTTSTYNLLLIHGIPTALLPSSYLLQELRRCRIQVGGMMGGRVSYIRLTQHMTGGQHTNYACCHLYSSKW